MCKGSSASLPPCMEKRAMFLVYHDPWQISGSHVLLGIKLRVQVSQTSSLHTGEAIDQIAYMAASGIDRTLTSKGTFLSSQVPQSSNVPLSKKLT